MAVGFTYFIRKGMEIYSKPGSYFLATIFNWLSSGLKSLARASGLFLYSRKWLAVLSGTRLVNDVKCIERRWNVTSERRRRDKWSPGYCRFVSLEADSFRNLGGMSAYCRAHFYVHDVMRS